MEYLLQIVGKQQMECGRPVLWKNSTWSVGDWHHSLWEEYQSVWGSARPVIQIVGKQSVGDLYYRLWENSTWSVGDLYRKLRGSSTCV